MMNILSIKVIQCMSLVLLWRTHNDTSSEWETHRKWVVLCCDWKITLAVSPGWKWPPLPGSSSRDNQEQQHNLCLHVCARFLHLFTCTLCVCKHLLLNSRGNRKHYLLWLQIFHRHTVGYNPAGWRQNTPYNFQFTGLQQEQLNALCQCVMKRYLYTFFCLKGVKYMNKLCLLTDLSTQRRALGHFYVHSRQMLHEPSHVSFHLFDL